jgi:hypothetical protein
VPPDQGLHGVGSSRSHVVSCGRGLSHNLSCHSLIHVPLSVSLEQRGNTAMEIEVAAMEVVAPTPSLVQTEVTTTLSGCTDGAFF